LWRRRRGHIFGCGGCGGNIPRIWVSLVHGTAHFWLRAAAAVIFCAFGSLYYAGPHIIGCARGGGGGGGALENWILRYNNQLKDSKRSYHSGRFQWAINNPLNSYLSWPKVKAKQPPPTHTFILW
jgi:hypothetical protein